MFLFQEDYINLPSSHIDMLTSNKSFIRMYYILKKMGVKNNKFFLLLADPSLSGIDPHNLPNDSLDLKLRIARECKVNPWYFFRAMIRVPAQGTDGIPFELNRANLSVIWLYLNHIDYLLIMPRQVGKTITAVSIAALNLYVLGSNITFAMLAKDSKLRKENVERLKAIRDGLPAWFLDKRRTDTDSKEEISYSALGNKYSTFVAQQNEPGADRLGRGMTTPTQHWDEVAFFPNIDITYPQAISATNAAIKSAAEHNQPYGNILTTTAGRLNNSEGVFVHKLICNSLTFSEFIYDTKDANSLREIVATNSRQRMVYGEFDLKQLGKTDQEIQDIINRTMGGQDIIDMDVYNRWVFGSEKSPLEKELRVKVYGSKEDPNWVQYIDEFMVKWYIPEKTVKTDALFSKIPVVIGMDGSENVGRDYTSFTLVDGRDLGVIGTCTCNTTNIIKVAIFVCRWLKMANVVFIPERNSVGCAIIDYCLLQLEKDNINPFFRIYNEVIQNVGLSSTKITKAELLAPGAYNTHRKSFGFRTSGQTRSLLYKTVFPKAMELAGHLIKDTTLVNQIGGLRIKNGRIDHSNSGHDDGVISYILAGYLLLFGNNLDWYDFSNGDIDNLLGAVKDKSIDTDKGTVKIKDIDSIRQEIATLDKQAKFTKDPTARIEILQKIHTLKQQLPNVSNDDLISSYESVSQIQRKKYDMSGMTPTIVKTMLSNVFSSI